MLIVLPEGYEKIRFFKFSLLTGQSGKVIGKYIWKFCFIF